MPISGHARWGKVNPLSGLPCAWTGLSLPQSRLRPFRRNVQFFFQQIEILPELHIEPPVCPLTILAHSSSMGRDAFNPGRKGRHGMARKIALARATAKGGWQVAALRCRHGIVVGVFSSAIMLFSQCALADEGGVSFWVPGFFGSLAAAVSAPADTEV
jgi:hypothetical protein